MKPFKITSHVITYITSRLDFLDHTGSVLEYTKATELTSWPFSLS